MNKDSADTKYYLHEHLNFVQQIVTRMGQNSFAIKAGYIAIIAGLLTFETNYKQNNIIINFIIMVIFVYLDAFYLTREREYRILYELLIKPTKINNRNPYSLTVPKKINIFKTIFSSVLLIFYAGIFGILTLFQYFQLTD